MSKVMAIIERTWTLFINQLMLMSVCLWTYSPFMFTRDKGLVRSPVTATLPQIGSRLFVAWGILWSFPEVKTNLNFFIYILLPLTNQFHFQLYSFIENLPISVNEDSDSCACCLPTNQLVHHRGKFFIVAFIMLLCLYLIMPVSISISLFMDFKFSHHSERWTCRFSGDESHCESWLLRNV